MLKYTIKKIFGKIHDVDCILLCEGGLYEMGSLKSVNFEDVFKDYYESMLSFIVKQVNNIDDAQDLNQEIWMKIYKSLSKYDPRKSQIKTWIYKIANNHIINFWKGSYLKSKSVYELDVSRLKSQEDILEEVIKDEDVRHILYLMKLTLSGKHVRVMNLYFFSSLSLNEISVVMKLKKKTVSNIVSRSISLIRKRLEEEYEKL